MEYWIWFSLLPYIGPITANRLLEHFGDPSKIYQAALSELMEIKGLSQRQIQSIACNKILEHAYKVLDDCDKNSIKVLIKSDIRYPEQAGNLKDAPVVLYYKGHFQDMNEPVAIVGARRCTQEAKFCAVELAEKYSMNGQTIISGMAKGIDSYAHTACLKVGGYTVAIVGNGLDICYPSEHKKLMECIMENGLLISEYPPGVRPTRYTFPMRNRLISAWAERIVIVTPGKGSGALITAEYGRKYGRIVEVVSDHCMEEKD